MAAGKKGTGPYGIGERGRSMHQIPVRVRKDELDLVKQRLEDDGMTFQWLVRAAVDAYLKNDMAMLKVVADWKAQNVIPKGHTVTFGFSEREKRELMEAIGHAPGEESDE